MTLLLGDCVEQMALLPEASVDAVVCDPPYGLEFMSKAWDAPWKTGDGFRRSRNPGDVERDDPFGRASRTSPEYRAGRGFQAWCEQWAIEALRVLKPGGHLLAFGGTRTYHRLACALEDAGFEIRDCLSWLYGSGFPKSLDVSKAIDKAAVCPVCLGEGITNYDRSLHRKGCEDCGGTGRATRRVVGVDADRLRRKPNGMKTEGATAYGYSRAQQETDARITAPATAEATQWEGWGTALKPAWEPIILARKPLAGTVAGNVLEWGTGALNIDATRIGIDEDERAVIDNRSGGQADANHWQGPGVARDVGERFSSHAAGRWPANVILDEPAARLLDQQSGERRSPESYVRSVRADRGVAYGEGMGTREAGDACLNYGDSGGASRFFYVAKASRAERNAGLDDPGPQFQHGDTLRKIENKLTGKGNHHPTVKPVSLMRWLCRLVTPPGGVILDPFLGSGTTGVAAVLEGFEFVGIEREAEYMEIAKRRIEWWRVHGEDALRIVREQEAAEAVRREVSDAGQLDLLGGAA